MTKLEKLICWCCSSLTEIPDFLKDLTYLDCDDCQNLRRLPQSLTKCRYLNVRKNSSLHRQPLPQLPPDVELIAGWGLQPCSFSVSLQEVALDPIKTLEKFAFSLLNERPFPVIHITDEKGELRQDIRLEEMRRVLVTTLLSALIPKVCDPQEHFDHEELAQVNLKTLGGFLSFALKKFPDITQKLSLPHKLFHMLQNDLDPTILPLISSKPTP